MRMHFLLAADLKKTFYTEGAFYHLDLDGESYKCRGLARISRRETKSEIADALFVLVNPGSCQPEYEDYQFPNYNNDISKIPFAQAKPDPTQYQIMRLMERRGWNMIYIINLSDLRSGNIEEFRMNLNNFEKKHNDSHSIFSGERKWTINSHLSLKTKVIAGWGTNSFISKRASHALSVLKELSKIHGLPHNTTPLYYHPFPMIKASCIKWLDDICEILDREDKDYE